MLRLNVDTLRDLVRRSSAFRNVGTLHSVHEIKRARIAGAVGQLCEIRRPASRWVPDGARVLGEIVGFDGELSQILSFHHVSGLQQGLPVVALGHPLRVPVGRALLGRVLNGLGQPIDGRGPLWTRTTRSPRAESPEPMTRPAIREPFVTGQRAIDGLLTLGLGQRIGLFAGSGVGKSTLLGEVAKVAQSDLNVIVLVGERGREVRPFLDECLGEAGRARSVVVVATSDEPPLMRIQSVATAITIAESFRDVGHHVLLMMDSLTRLAMAQREIGLLCGEPPGARGYPPSAIQILARSLERLGTAERGSITGLITVLVDGDDLDEPVADAARSILDGHIVLSRKLAARGHFPAIDVLASVSRLFNDVTEPEHRFAAQRIRDMLATYDEMSELIQIGAYTPGSSPVVDQAIRLRPAVNALLRQSIGEATPLRETRAALIALGQQWDQQRTGA